MAYYDLFCTIISSLLQQTSDEEGQGFDYQYGRYFALIDPKYLASKKIEIKFNHQKNL